MVAVALMSAWAASGTNSGLSSHASHTCLSLPYASTPTLGGFFWRQRTTQHQTLGTFFLKENVNSLTPPRDLDKLQSGWKLPSFILPRPHWLKICRSNDFAECLQSVLLLGILSSTAFKWVVTVHKVKRVSFPFQMQKDTRRVRSLGQKKKAWHSPL